MNNDRSILADSVVYEASLIPDYSDMLEMLSQEGIPLNNRMKDYLKQVALIPIPDEAECAKLLAELENGSEEAGNTLIEGHLRLVICAAGHYADSGVMFSDLVQEGSVGLVTAVYSYSSESGDFARCAAGSVIEAVESLVHESTETAKIPERVTELLQKISRSDMTLEMKLGREATPEEIAEDTGISLEEVESVMEMMESAAEQDEEKVVSEGDECGCGDENCGETHHHEHHHHGH